MPTLAELSKIHIAKKDLGFSDEDYRAMLLGRYKVESSKDLTQFQTSDLLGFFKKQGWVPKLPARADHPAGKRPARPHNLESEMLGPQLQKIEALLADGKLSWAYAKAMAKRMCRKEALEFCNSDELRGIISALTIQARRVAARKVAPRKEGA